MGRLKNNASDEELENGMLNKLKNDSKKRKIETKTGRSELIEIATVS